MDISVVRGLLDRRGTNGFDVYERRAGAYQLIIPILHEDGDMVDIYLQASPLGENHVRICDFGLTLMRLSYTLNMTDARQRILDSILINNKVNNIDGNLYLDASLDLLYEYVLQFAGCVQKVCNMRYWSRETVRSAFYDDLEDYITTELKEFSPSPDFTPIEGYPVSVDWRLKHNSRDLYVFGVLGNDKAKVVAIAMLEFEKERTPFVSLVVHEDMEGLGKKERQYLTKNAYKQYPILDDFRERAPGDIRRFAA